MDYVSLVVRSAWQNLVLSDVARSLDRWAARDAEGGRECEVRLGRSDGDFQSNWVANGWAIIQVLQSTAMLNSGTSVRDWIPWSTPRRSQSIRAWIRF